MIDHDTYFTSPDGVNRHLVTIQICGPGPLNAHDVMATITNLFEIPGFVPFETLIKVLVPLAFRLLVTAARL